MIILNFLKRYFRYFSSYFETYAYCLIPNHFHFLVKVKDEVEYAVTKENTNAAKKYLKGEEDLNFFIEHQLSRMFSGVALKFNKKNNRVGPLFKEGVKRVELRTEGRIIYQLCYIHHNPIHHKLTSKYESWQYSSFLSYINDKSSQIATDKMIGLLGGVDVFLSLHKEFKSSNDEGLFKEK